MSTSPRRWNWISFAAGMVVGIPLGFIGLILVAQILTVMISLP